MSDFIAATWNVYHGTPVRELEPIFCDLIGRGVSVILMQEAKRSGIVRMLERHGWQSHKVGPECIVAWDASWEARGKRRIRLSKPVYWRQGGAKVVVRAPLVTLKRGRHKVDALSYHLPSAIQRGGRPNRKVGHRLRVVRAAMSKMRSLSRWGRRRAKLFGGDDNWDEARGFWRVMHMGFTRLRLVRSPRPTHGKRRIDDFRTRHLDPGKGWTIDGGGDHRIHIREFNFR